MLRAEAQVIKASFSYSLWSGSAISIARLPSEYKERMGRKNSLRLEMSCGPNLWGWHINSALKFTHWCFIKGFYACSSQLQSCSLPLWNLKKFNRIWCSRFIMHYLIVTLSCAVITHLTGAGCVMLQHNGLWDCSRVWAVVVLHVMVNPVCWTWRL